NASATLLLSRAKLLGNGASVPVTTRMGEMRYRLPILLLVLVPVLALAGLSLAGRTLPVPVLGRAYVVRIELPQVGETVDLPPVVGPQDPDRPLIVIDAG